MSRNREGEEDRAEKAAGEERKAKKVKGKQNCLVHANETKVYIHWKEKEGVANTARRKLEER